jgi:hypothetical protein
MLAESEQQARLESLPATCNRSQLIRVHIPISCCWRIPGVFEERGHPYVRVITEAEKHVILHTLRILNRF